MWTCGLLLIAYAAIAWAAVRQMSPTFDEPYHALSAWVQLHERDYRIDNEDPPLWQYWASLPNGPAAVRFDPAHDLQWQRMNADVQAQWPWTVRMLYRTPGVDGAAFVQRCRAMMLIIAVGLGVLIAAWAWRIAGPVAAVVATALFCLDPNFLGHGPLMKNDVAFTLAMTGLTVALWRVGRGVTTAGVVWVVLCGAVMLTVKFSGLIAAVIIPAVLGGRVLLPEPWPVFGRPLATRSRRAAVAAGLVAVAALTSFASIWAAYGFRYAPTSTAGVDLNLAALADRAATNAAFIRSAHGGSGLPGMPWAVRAALTADRHHGLPQGYVAGFLFTYANNLVRPGVLLGHESLVGWWYYFPLAAAFKTPVATLVAAVAILATMAWRPWWRSPVARWTVLALAIPFGLFAASALSSNLNIGLRHVFPLYPPAFVAIGWAVAAGLRRSPRVVRTSLVVLAIGLVAETANAYPDYISFFNTPSVDAGRGGFDLLGDSNLDWGQGLIALGRWQRKHPDDLLYLSYFGLADPSAYGLRYVSLPGGYRYDQAARRFPNPRQACWLAVSVNNLQGAVLEDERLRPYYRQLANRRPDVVVGGAIYLYRYNPYDGIREP